MGYLLTAGVLGFQIVIFATIVGAGAISRGKLWLVTAGWVAFTLFGSIFTAGLLLLQLLTIAFSYAVGSAMGGHSAPKDLPNKVPPPIIEQASPSGLGALQTIAIVGAIVWLAYIFLGAKHQTPTEAASPAQVQSLPVPAALLPKTSSRTTSQPRKVKPAQRKPLDLRHCLSLKTNEAITRCTEQAQ